MERDGRLALGGCGNAAMLTVRRMDLSGLPEVRHTEGDRNELLFGDDEDGPRLEGTVDLVWAVVGDRNFEGREGVEYNLADSPGPGILFLDFEAGIGGRADVGGLRGGGLDGNRDGCGIVEVISAA